MELERKRAFVEYQVYPYELEKAIKREVVKSLGINPEDIVNLEWDIYEDVDCGYQGTPCHTIKGYEFRGCKLKIDANAKLPEERVEEFLNYKDEPKKTPSLLLGEKKWHPEHIMNKIRGPEYYVKDDGTFGRCLDGYEIPEPEDDGERVVVCYHCGEEIELEKAKRAYIKRIGKIVFVCPDCF